MEDGHPAKVFWFLKRCVSFVNVCGWATPASRRPGESIHEYPECLVAMRRLADHGLTRQ